MKKYWVNRDYLSDIPPEWRAKKLGCFVYKAIDVAELAREVLPDLKELREYAECCGPESDEMKEFDKRIAKLDALAKEGDDPH